jgi:chromosome segregation ATPase
MTIEELEQHKLQLEIGLLERKWYQKPEFFQGVLPTVLAIFSLIYALSTGFFSRKSELLELRKGHLEIEIKQFERDRGDLISMNDHLKNRSDALVDSLSSQNHRLKIYEQAIDEERATIASLSEELNSLKQTKQNYDTKIRQLREDYDKKKASYLGELRSNYHREFDLEHELEEYGDRVSQLENKIKALEYNIAIVPSYPVIKKFHKSDFETWINQKMIEYYEIESKEIETRMKARELESESLLKRLDSSNVKLKLLNIK